MKQRVRTLLQLAVVFALVLSLAPLQAIAQEGMSEKADIVATAIAAGDFTALVELVEAAGLTETLQGEGPFTVFAPTDAAFAAVPADVLEALAADPEALQSVLLYHVVPGRLIAALISDGKEVATAEGSNVLFSFADGVKQVNGATIVAKDIQASNGVIHVIDSVILPPELAAALGVGEAPAAEATPEATEEATAAEATPAATEEAAAEATPVATEEAAAEATPEATEEAAAEATPAATEEVAAEATPEATEEAAAEATPAATEEAAAAEATPEATEEAAAEATPAATEEAAAAEATPEATEEAAAEAAMAEAPAPDSLPVTGGESNSLGMLAAVLVLIVVAGVAVTARRRLA
jgi:LPXTG-motif cell wall-anchored protein